ncbi:Type III restriction enzyme, res subunit [Paenibacillus sp. GP183]|nr:Type III restriction enzyme, res subunit [Paenibacillus sp. GP183]
MTYRARNSQAITSRVRNSRAPTRRAAKFLIWAVTGVGKTEMIFPFIQHIVANGGKMLVATPRKDVVLELQPRVMKAFAGRSVVTLYGGCLGRRSPSCLEIEAARTRCRRLRGPRQRIRFAPRKYSFFETE